MKKLLLAGGMIMMMLSSCHRDWNCQCTDQSGNVTSTTINDETLVSARNKCKSMDYSNTTLGVTTSESCSLQ